jgi:hypothetical protein
MKSGEKGKTEAFDSGVGTGEGRLAPLARGSELKKSQRRREADRKKWADEKTEKENEKRKKRDKWINGNGL